MLVAARCTALYCKVLCMAAACALSAVHLIRTLLATHPGCRALSMLCEKLAGACAGSIVRACAVTLAVQHISMLDALTEQPVQACCAALKMCTASER